MKKTVIYVLAECLADERFADLTIHGAFPSLDKAKATMLEKIEERFDYIKDDLCDDEEEWKKWVNARFWNTVEDSEHKVAWSDDDGDTVSKFLIDEVEVGFEESEKISELENEKLLEEIESIIDVLIDRRDIHDVLEAIEKQLGPLSFVDTKIYDGCDENKDGDKYIMMNSYNLEYKGRSFYLRLFYGNRSQIVGTYDIEEN